MTQDRTLSRRFGFFLAAAAGERAFSVIGPVNCLGVDVDVLPNRTESSTSLGPVSSNPCPRSCEMTCPKRVTSTGGDRGFEVADRYPESGDITVFRDGFAVHGRFGKPCPVCGACVQRIRLAERERNYCRNVRSAARCSETDRYPGCSKMFGPRRLRISKRRIG